MTDFTTHKTGCGQTIIYEILSDSLSLNRDILLIRFSSSLALLHKCSSTRKRRDEINTIDYSHANLSVVPEDILVYENTVEELNLGANCLQELPKVKYRKLLFCSEKRRKIFCSF